MTYINELWCRDWQMNINIETFKLLTLSRSTISSSFSYHLGSISIGHCTSCKYLRHHLTTGLMRSNEINELVLKTKGTLGYLRHNMQFASPEIKKLACTTLKRSQLEYSQSEWWLFQNYLIND